MKRKYKTISLICVIITVLSLASCAKPQSDFYKTEFSATQGKLTLWIAYAHGDEKHNKKFSEEELVPIAQKAAQRFENVMYTLTSGEELAEINGENNVALDLNPETVSAIRKAFELSQNTNGAYTPAHGAYAALVRENAATEEAVATALAHCGTDKFTLSETSVKKSDKEASLDFSSFAAGYALDEALKVLKENDVDHARVTFGGVEAVFGAKPNGKVYTIGIKEIDKITGYFRVTDGGVAEATEKDRGKNYSASSKGDFRSVTVFSPEASAAQALSRILINMTETEAAELYKSSKTDFEAVMVKTDGKVLKTDRVDTGLYVPETSESK